MKEKFVTTEKGLAVIAAIESELMPEVEGGWDDTKFNEFWEKYQSSLHERKKKKDRLPIISLIVSAVVCVISIATLIVKLVC